MQTPVHQSIPAPTESASGSRAILAPSITCVLPAYNEARNLGTVVPEVLAAALALSLGVEIIVVDDGSRDDTALVMHGLCAAHPQVVYVQFSRNFGKEAALTAGLDAARRRGNFDGCGWPAPMRFIGKHATQVEAWRGRGVCRAQNA
jgi:cellulose synthase/poly-beta-1,6-N-acetylglucosamine synthase-like glycosyltransferase